VLSDAERGELTGWVRRPTTAQRMVLRARIVLAAADGMANAAIGRRVGVVTDTVRKWRRRFVQRRMSGLADRKRPGRPRRFTDVQTAQVKALACELPATRGVPLSRWSAAELAHEAVEAGIVEDISASTVARLLAADAIKPWRHRSWICPRDPDFAAKAAVVLDLYQRVWQGKPLGDNDFVISADEKTSIQARCRCHPTLPPGVSRLMRVEHEYQRGGAVAHLAALDVRSGKVTGRVRSIEHGNLLDQESLELMVEHGTFLTPTLTTYWALKNEGPKWGLPPESHAKVDAVLDAGLDALRLAHEAGVKLCYGTDCLGGMQRHQLREFTIRAQVQPAIEVIRAATVNAAELLGQTGKLGVISEGAHADLVVVDGDPLADISVLVPADGHQPAVIQAGKVVSGSLTPDPDGQR